MFAKYSTSIALVRRSEKDVQKFPNVVRDPQFSWSHRSGTTKSSKVKVTSRTAIQSPHLRSRSLSRSSFG